MNARMNCVVTALALVACCAQANDRNPLKKPAKASPAVSGTLPPSPISTGAPSLADPLGFVAGGASPADLISAHLGALRVVATVGSKAILRGPLGKHGNLVPGRAEPADGLPGVLSGVAAPDSAVKRGPDRSITVTHGEPMQISSTAWLRPEVSGTSVRLFLQSSRKEATETLVYASALEIAVATAPSSQQVVKEYESDTKAGKGSKPDETVSADTPAK